MDDSEEDQRDIELASLTAIFPEIRRVREDNPYSIAIDIPVKPSNEVTVFFPAAGDGAGVNAVLSRNGALAVAGPGGQVTNVDSHELSYLPSVTLEISLPTEYPSGKPPAVSISTLPSWLPVATAQKLAAVCTRLWEELGRDLVVFSFIDHVQQCAEDVFALVNGDGSLEIDPQHKIAVLDHDIKAKRTAFENGTFDCGVCLEPKKGKVCHRMLDCGHVFCVQCLQDFYNTAITEGDLASVRCLEPSCAKDRDVAQTPAGKKRRKPKTYISPSELLQIPLEPDVVKRYVSLKYKTELEADKNTIYCPRSWCQGAARSKKHRKPADGLDFEQDATAGSDSEQEEDENDAGEAVATDSPTGKTPTVFQTKDLLAVCEDCGFAFCSRCYQSWHGEFYRCTPRRDKEELSAEEKASLDYVKLHTTPCPTCDCPAQKTHGCNHMICFRCNTHFCYLCSAWLDPGNPYRHFNEMPDGSRTGCYMRLWELEDGDGDDVGYGFAGGLAARALNGPPEVRPVVRDRMVPAAPEPVLPWHPLPEIEEPDDLDEDGDEGNDGEPQVGVAREGPLVLRIDANPRPGRARPAPPPAPNPPPAVGRDRALNNPVVRPRQQQQRQEQQAGQRGQRRRGRGGQIGAVDRGGAAHRQNHQEQHHHRQRGGGPGRNVAQGREGPEQIGRQDGEINQRVPGADPVELDVAQQAWIRHFVQLALDDNEDLVESDSDEDIEELVFWVND